MQKRFKLAKASAVLGIAVLSAPFVLTFAVALCVESRATPVLFLLNVLFFLIVSVVKVRASWGAKASLILGYSSLASMMLVTFTLRELACARSPGMVSFLTNLVWLGLIVYIPGSLCAVVLGIACLFRMGRTVSPKKAWAMIGPGCALAGLAILLVPEFVVFALLRHPYRRIEANEDAAIRSLKVIAAQQAKFKQQLLVDQDTDGVGEYGYLCELAGEIAPRKKGATRPVSPPHISRKFHTGASRGRGFAEDTRWGYRFRIYLPGKDGQPTEDSACDGTASTPSITLDPKTDRVAIDAQENRFVAYAWPIRYIKGEVDHCTGWSCFVTDHAGNVHATMMRNQTYSGLNGPIIEAAFSAKGDGTDGWFNDKFAEGEYDTANDGNTWEACAR